MRMDMVRPSKTLPGRYMSQYASTPHLFVFQPPDEDVCNMKEPVYSSATELHTVQEKQAIQRITEKYDSFKNLAGGQSELIGYSVGEELSHSTETQPFNSADQFGYSADTHQGYSADQLGHSADNDLTVTEQDMIQIEAFFKGHKTQVFVCGGLANLYDTCEEGGGWKLKFTGIPALLLDTGETRSRSKRRLQLVLAEKGTGFMLWKDTIDNLSSYHVPDPSFHTMHLSTDHRRKIGFSFDDTMAAKDFYEKLERLISDPANISLSGPGRRKKNKPKKKTEKFRLPKKADISQPCCFQHVSSVELADKSRFYSLQTLIPAGHGQVV